MVVIFGGAYQGKLAFAKERFALGPGEIHYCTEAGDALDLSCRCISGLHRSLLGKVRRGESCASWLEQLLPSLRGKILLCDDISCGVVPVAADLRAWREETGRTLARLCRESDAVYRLFCGLPTQLRPSKGDSGIV